MGRWLELLTEETRRLAYNAWNDVGRYRHTRTDTRCVWHHSLHKDCRPHLDYWGRHLPGGTCGVCQEQRVAMQWRREWGDYAQLGFFWRRRSDGVHVRHYETPQRPQ